MICVFTEPALKQIGRVRHLSQCFGHSVSSPKLVAAPALEGYSRNAMPNSSNKMDMLFAFPDPSPSFVHGFEAGDIWSLLDSGQIEPIDRGWHTGFPVHTANIDLIRRMAQVRGFLCETRPTDYNEWTAVLLTHVGEGNVKPALSLVKSDTDHA